MGGFISKIENDKITEVNLSVMGQKTLTSKTDKVLEKYVNYLNKYGFYKVKLDPNKFADFLISSFGVGVNN